jgi:hypothetical protein
MTVDEVVSLVEEVREDFVREEDQGLLQEDLGKAKHAMAGKHACDRILRKIEARAGLNLVKPRMMGRAR